MFAWLFSKSNNEQIKDFEQKINTITTSLVKQQDQSELAALLNPQQCNQYTLFLGSELDKRFKKVELEDLNTQIYIVKRPKKSEKNGNNNMNIDNYKGTDKNYSKQELCTKIASHYIRTFNIISSILTAINPERNMCSRRIKALYDSISDTDSGYVKICKSDDTDNKNKLYPDNIDELPGIKQLLNLYYFYLMQDNTNQEYKNRVERDFALLNQALSNVYTSSVEIPLTIKNVEASLDRSILNLNKVQGDDRIAELTALVTELKEQINNFKQNPASLLNEINHKINDKLQMFEGNIEDKIQALEHKITTTVQEHEFNKTGQGNVIKENLKENEITESLKQISPTITPKLISHKKTPQITDEEQNYILSSRFDINPKQKSKSKPSTPDVGPFPKLPHLSIKNHKGGNYINNNDAQTQHNNNQLNNNTNINQLNNNNNNDNINTNTNININTNTNTNNQNQLTFNENNQSVMSNFINFVEKLNKNKQINPKYKLHLRPKTIDELSTYKCTSEPSNVVIKINDSKFTNFKDIYEKMKSHYNNSSSSLIDILESKILDKTGDNYSIKSLNNAQLNEIQHQVMLELVNYYTKCQELYDSAFTSLAKALEE